MLPAILAGIKALATLLGLIQQQTDVAAGRTQVQAADASALAKAEGAIAAIATEGQDDAKTTADLGSGAF